ncbi:hypothetical protein GF312_08015 [Candidatus Poribacteria bacterium]|nr:hypothetical protein [Candidatus Poribacteria bacterium]
MLFIFPHSNRKGQNLLKSLKMIGGVMSSKPKDELAATKFDFFVSTEGDDSWSGKLASPNADKTDGPFATISRAKDAIREMKEAGELDCEAKVIIRGGKYFLDETVVFDQKDSGTAECPITYMAYPGEKPIISGGKRITGPWKKYKDDILVCQLDEVKSGKWIFRQLFANSKRQTRARLPHEGYYFIDGVVGNAAFKYKDQHFKKFHNLTDVEVVMFHSWNETRFIVDEVDEESKTVKCLDPKARHVIGWHGGGGANRYYIENVFEGLTQPGDWYLDVHTGELYYWPVDDIDNLEIIAPVLKQIMKFEGGLKEQCVQYINIEGLTFADTKWPLPEKGYPDCGDVGDIVDPSAVTMENVRYIKFQNNTMRNIGTYALELTGYGCKIVDNVIYDIGGGGIISRNYDEERNDISYNHIHHCGQVYPSAVGINIDDGGGVVTHNLIHNIAHSGIYTRHWATKTQPIQRENQEQGLIIEYNEIYDVMEKINDGGGLFVRDANIIIRYNLIHDVYSFSDRCPGWGIYLGCETRDTLVENNLVYRAREGVHVWYSDRNITMENNIFLDGEISQINYQNPQDRKHENIKFNRNIVCFAKANWKLYRLSGMRSAPVESDYNLYYCPEADINKTDVITGLEGVKTFADWQENCFDKNSLVADPMFVDPDNDDYTLKSDSPALKLGFKPFDLSEVGLRGREKKS